MFNPHRFPHRYPYKLWGPLFGNWNSEISLKKSMSSSLNIVSTCHLNILIDTFSLHQIDRDFVLRPMSLFTPQGKTYWLKNVIRKTVSKWEEIDMAGTLFHLCPHYYPTVSIFSSDVGAISRVCARN